MGRHYITDTTFKDVLGRLRAAFDEFQYSTIAGCIRYLTVITIEQYEKGQRVQGGGPHLQQKYPRPTFFPQSKSPVGHPPCSNIYLYDTPRIPTAVFFIVYQK